MKVALVTNVPEDLDQPRGGVQSTAVATIRALTECPEIELHVIVVNRAIRQDADRRLDGTTLYYRRSKPGSVLIGMLTGQRRMVTRLLAEIRPDVVHACDTSYFKVGYRECPVIYHLQGTIHADTLYRGSARRLRSALWYWLERRGLKHADAILVSTPAIAETIAPVRTQDVFVSDEPVNPEFWAIKRQPAARTYPKTVAQVYNLCLPPVENRCHRDRCHRGCGIDSNNILCIGGVNELKNSAALVEAAALLKERGIATQIRFAGGATPEYEASLRELMAARGVTERCTLLGHLSRAGIATELSTAAILAHPSRREHAPAAISEALVVGVPVVASHVGGIPYLVDDGVTGFLIDPEDHHQLAGRLELLLRDEELRQTMGQRARAAAQARFSGPAVARRLCQVYQQVLAKRLDQATAGELIT